MCAKRTIAALAENARSRAYARNAFLAVCVTAAAWAQAPRNITINYPAKAPASLAAFITQQSGAYQKYGFNTNLIFGVHPTGIAMLVSGEAIMTNQTLAMQAASKDGSLVIVGAPMNRGLFALMGRKNLKSIKELKGKRIGVSQIGDAPYNFAIAMLGKAGLRARDVDFLSLGADSNGRVAALVSGRIDATRVPPPAYFKLEGDGYKPLANLADFPDAFHVQEIAVAANPKLPEQLIEAHAGGIQSFYADKALAIKSTSPLMGKPHPPTSNASTIAIKRPAPTSAFPTSWRTRSSTSSIIKPMPTLPPR